MSDPFTRLVMRETGGGGGGKRREPPPARPPFVAHVCTDWTPEHVQKHLAACERGRDPVTGEWDIDPDDADQSWAWMWEMTPATRPDGSWRAWTPVIREMEVP